jgi:hypothetical protein
VADLERTRQALADGTFRRVRLEAGMSQRTVERLYDVDGTTSAATNAASRCLLVR